MATRARPGARRAGRQSGAERRRETVGEAMFRHGSPTPTAGPVMYGVLREPPDHGRSADTIPATEQLPEKSRKISAKYDLPVAFPPLSWYIIGTGRGSGIFLPPRSSLTTVYFSKRVRNRPSRNSCLRQIQLECTGRVTAYADLAGRFLVFDAVLGRTSDTCLGAFGFFVSGAAGQAGFRSESCGTGSLSNSPKQGNANAAVVTPLRIGHSFLPPFT